MLNKPYTRCLAAWTLGFFVTLGGFFGAGPAQAGNPAKMTGVMTRWQTTSATACEQTFDGAANQPACPRSLMFTITPNLMGLSVQNWVQTLASEGVNTGVIYVVPGYRLATTPTIDQATWQAYNADIYLPPSTLMDSQKQVILQVGEAISKKQYTVAQRNYAILAFLSQLQQAFPSSTPVKFILDERVWFISHINDQGQPVTLSKSKVFSLEQDYSDDISGLVQAAVQQGTDHWVTGVRLSEYASKDWNLMGPVMVDLATEINAKANGWLTNHTFIGAGGGWGQDWKGVNAMQCPTTAGWQFPACSGNFPFFQDMSQQVKFFAFGDKFMEFGKPEKYALDGEDTDLSYTYINGEITDFCQENARGYVCNNPAAPSVTDWQAFLEDNVDGLGLSDLIHFMEKNAANYPQLANVIFEGDNSDSSATMTLPASANGATALSDIFADAVQGAYPDAETATLKQGLTLGSWTGKIFLDGFDDTSSVPRPGFYGDSGYSMFDTSYNDFMFAPGSVQLIARNNSTAYWQNWP